MKKLALTLTLALAACTQSLPANTVVAPRELLGSDAASHLVPGHEARFTVLVFFADHCPCQSAHDARLRELYAAYHARGVDILAVDSEVSQSTEKDKSEAARRAYPFPILQDRGATLARALHVEFATEAFVLDRSGTVRYHGGIDSDKKRLHADATPYLRDALDDLLQGRQVRRPESEALGCALQTW